MTNLLAEVYQACLERRARTGTPFTYAATLRLFEETLLPGAERRNGEFPGFTSATVRAAYQRLRALPAALGGLLDAEGTGYGLEAVERLAPFDLLVVDLERVLAAPPDPQLADMTLQMVVAIMLRRLTESMTRRCVLTRASKAKTATRVDHVILFCDELNTLAPIGGRSGVGAYLSHVARTTRDRGIIVFGVCQFRSEIQADLARAAATQLYLRTSADELLEPASAGLEEEVRARLLALGPGARRESRRRARAPASGHQLAAGG
jgi:hypothetical protein